MGKRIVIIGGVACGPKAAARARRLDPEAEITIIEKGELLSYAGCGLPYFLSGDVKDIKGLMETPVGVVRDTVFFKNVKDITVLNRTLADSIDRKKKVVRVVNIKTGERSETSYDKLVLATGGTPFLPPIPGRDALNNVFTLCSQACVEDAAMIDLALGRDEIKRAVIIGGGLIGLELTEAFVRRGLVVTVVEMLDRILPNLFDWEMSAFLTRCLAEKGVSVLTGTKVNEIKGDAAGNVSRVITDKGEIPAEAVLVAVGVRPNVKLAMDCGLDIGQLGGIVIDEQMRTSDPDIYAGGDCVEQIGVVHGKRVFIPMGSTANKHGRVIGTNVTGGGEKFKGVCGTSIVKVFDCTAAATGLSEEAARKAGFDVETILSPSPDKAHFYPGAKPIGIKLVADKETRKLLGAQIIGPGDVDKRIDVAATAVGFGATVDQVANLDLGYAPPYSPAMDNIITAANIMRNKLDGTGRSVTPMEAMDRIKRGTDCLFLDVRMPSELDEQGRLPSDKVVHIPLGKLRTEAHTLPKNKEIIAFCKISLRGYEAAKTLEGLGFKDVKFLDGGIMLWPYEKRK
jgi:NADPH-dependent 2,4-dienoyl-CoA reductase/sulfur reductase-like enzyme/rhodanese-related sulfurtransferase